jgi:starch synthase
VNICYLYLHRFAGRGSGRYMQSLLQYLKERKHRLFLVEGLRSKHSVLRGINVKYVHFPFQVPVYTGRTDVKKNIRISTIPDSHVFNIISRFAEWEIKIHEKVGLDITHASHASVLPYSALLAKRVTGIPYVVTAHGTGMASSLESKRNFELARRGLEESEKVIANSKFIKRGLIRDFGLKNKKVKVIYPGVNTSLFRPVSRRMKAATKRKCGCEGRRVVLSSGYFTKDMGFQYLLDAARIYEKEDPDIVTLITGQGPYQKDMERLIKRHGLKNVRITGWVLRKELVKIYGAADIFVKPAMVDEPFGLVPVEALATETPVIATKTGGIPEIVTGDVGEVVRPRSARAIADAVLDRIRDDAWIKRKGKKGRKRVVSYFSAKIRGREMEKVYRQAVG